jgi:inorganic phosphate transporter, PiT family
MMIVALFLAALWVAYANGANDNFKGVATLHGSGVASYKQSLALTTVATFAGCLASIFVAAELLRAFSGKGLVPDGLAGTQPFLLAVALGAGGTVMLATRLAFPISTTHALTGALVGAGLVAAGDGVNLGALGKTFVVPLLLSPMVALLLSMTAQAVLRRVSQRLALQPDDCACVTVQTVLSPVMLGHGAMALTRQNVWSADVGRGEACEPRGAPTTGDAPKAQPRRTLGDATRMGLQRGRVWGLTAQRALTAGHVASAAVLCFARGMNDTPKIAALLVAAQATQQRYAMLVVALAMAVGGLLGARKVAQTMSKGIATTMPDGPAFAANVVTGLLVIAASRYGLPVSTTHVSVGAISGLGLSQGTLDKRVLRNVVASWVVTLPVAAALAATAMWIILNTSPNT